MAAIGTITRFVIGGGLLGFLILAFVPNRESMAVQFAMVTPIVAAGMAGLELIIHKKPWHGLAMLGAVALAVGGMLVGVTG
jgi:hypothetical protein